MTKLGLLMTGVLTLGLSPVMAHASTSTQATYANRSWYCFGKKATITTGNVFTDYPNGDTMPGPNDPNYDSGGDPPVRGHGHTYTEFIGTPGNDVIVTTDGDDQVYAGAGDLICTRAGSDAVYLALDDMRWTKVDLGPGDDFVYDQAGCVWDGPCNQKPRGPLYAFGGPGNDHFWGGNGSDRFHGDSGISWFHTGGGEDWCSWGPTGTKPVMHPYDGNPAHWDPRFDTQGWPTGCEHNYPDHAYQPHVQYRSTNPPMTTTTRAGQGTTVTTAR